MKTWLLLLLVPVAAGGYRPHPLFHARPALAPPPLALSWLEGAQRGWVGVVNLGDGQRWLRALHARARTSVTTWRAPRGRERAAVPHWLENTPAYILAAHQPHRLFDFLLKKMHVNITIMVGEEKAMFRRSFDLNSRARGVISISSPHSVFEEGTKTEETAVRLFWWRHQSFLALVVRPKKAPTETASHGEEGDWYISHLDSFALGEMEGKPFHSMDAGSFKLIPSHTPPGVLESLLSRRATDLNGCNFVIVNVPYFADDFMADLRSFGRPDISLGYILRSFTEILRSINATVKYKHLRGSHADYQAAIKTIIFGEERVVSSIVDMEVKKPIVDLLPASADNRRTLVVVPRATRLPAWSLPLRAFPPTLWALLAGALAAYTLAWHFLTRESWSRSIVAALRAFSSYCGRAQERVYATPQRLQLAGTLLASSVVIVSLYQGRIFTITVDPEYAEEIETLEQLAATRLSFVTSREDEIPLFLEWTSEASGSQSAAALQIVKERHVQRDNFDTFVKGLPPSEAYLLAEDSWRFTLQLFPEAAATHRRMRVSFGSTLFAYPVRRNLPWQDVLNERVLWVQSAGLTSHWEQRARRDFALFSKMEYPVNATAATAEPFRKLYLSDLWPHFQILGAGVALGALSLVGEYQWRRFKWPSIHCHCRCATKQRRA